MAVQDPPAFDDVAFDLNAFDTQPVFEPVIGEEYVFFGDETAF